MRYISDRGVWILVLLACVSLLLAGASSVLGWQAYFAKRDARVVIQRADSVLAEWATRKCIPR